MSLPLEIEDAFADVRKQISSNHKGIRRSLTRLRTIVVGHYDGVREELATLKADVATLKHSDNELALNLQDQVRRLKVLESLEQRTV